MSTVSFPSLAELGILLREDRERFVALWSCPVLVRRVDPIVNRQDNAKDKTKDSRSFHTRGAASVEMVEDAMRLNRKGDTQTGTGEFIIEEPLIRVDSVIALRKREGAITGENRIGIGRASNLDVSLPLPRLSKYHAYFTDAGGQSALCDMRATYGTFIDDQPLEPLKPAPLENGIAIRLGPYHFRYHDPSGLRDYLERLGRVRDSIPP